MKKLVVSLVLMLLILGVSVNTPFLLAEAHENDSENDTDDSDSSIEAEANVTINTDSDDDSDDDDENESDEDEDENTCEEISGETFKSIRQYEVGNSPRGVVMGYWNINFKDGRFSWRYSDIVEEGSYVCDGKLITGTSSVDRKITGELNGDILFWEGIEYSEIDDDDNDEKESDDDDRDEERKDRNETRIKERIREIIREGNCTIKIEKTIKIEDGKRVEVIKRRMICADGTREEVKIRIENRTEDGRFRESIKYEFRGHELNVNASDDIDLEEEENATHYRLKARLRSNGNVTYIIIMPDTASEIAIERLRALNFTVELKEMEHGNVPRVVYNIEADKHGRFLGVFKLKMKVEGQVDPETGEFLGEGKPWWAFLVTGEDSDQTDDNSEGNETNPN